MVCNGESSFPELALQGVSGELGMDDFSTSGVRSLALVIWPMEEERRGIIKGCIDGKFHLPLWLLYSCGEMEANHGFLFSIHIDPLPPGKNVGRNQGLVQRIE